MAEADDIYEALRKRARQQRRPIAAEVLSLLEEHIPSEKELGHSLPLRK